MNDDSTRLDEDEIRQALDDAEPPKGTIEWAEHIINDIYEKKILGPPKDITKAHEPLYIEAAAIFSIEDGARFQRLKDQLKNRGVRGASMTDWERRVRERQHEIKKERDKLEKAEARKQAKDQKSASAASPTPTWEPLASTCQQPVDGYELLRDIRNAITKFVRLEEFQAIVVALWILFTWVFEKVAETNPFLRVLSPQPKCGKSTLLKVLRYLTRAGWLIASATKSAFIRNAQVRRFTFLMDEGDAFLSENEEFRNVLDSASDPDTAIAALSEKIGDSWVPINIECFLPIVIASIRKLRNMETVEDRSIHIQLKRATPAERKILTKARRRELKATLEPIANRCARWAQDNMDRLVKIRPVFELDDGRDEDKWEPLIAIADYLDVRLGKRVREIAQQMTGSNADAQESLDVLLLSDIKLLFDRQREQKLPGDENADKFSSKSLCPALAELQERPWASLPYGKGERKAITQNRLAAMLKEFEIKPHEIWISGKNARGFERKDFEDAWLRYVREPETKDAEKDKEEPLAQGEDRGENTTSFSENPLSRDPECESARPIGGVGESGDFQGARESRPSTPENATSPHAENDSSTLALQNDENRENEKQMHSEGRLNPLTDAEEAGAAATLNAAKSSAEQGGYQIDDPNGIPFMITEKQKVRLRTRGYSDNDIAKLTPEQVHEILLADRERF